MYSRPSWIVKLPRKLISASIGYARKSRASIFKNDKRIAWTPRRCDRFVSLAGGQAEIAPGANPGSKIRGFGLRGGKNGEMTREPVSGGLSFATAGRRCVFARAQVPREARQRDANIQSPGTRVQTVPSSISNSRPRRWPRLVYIIPPNVKLHRENPTFILSMWPHLHFLYRANQK
ncbi:hypothetical protein PUN28_000281 [Cardiocondyla obscurior]|uniref:Ribosomal protein L2 n=1 Tax=Cardiocondyla obscurior TaxID=286306 RepID=A0AAW2GYQ7_9HYME